MSLRCFVEVSFLEYIMNKSKKISESKKRVSLPILFEKSIGKKSNPLVDENLSSVYSDVIKKYADEGIIHCASIPGDSNWNKVCGNGFSPFTVKVDKKTLEQKILTKKTKLEKSMSRKVYMVVTPFEEKVMNSFVDNIRTHKTCFEIVMPRTLETYNELYSPISINNSGEYSRLLAGLQADGIVAFTDILSSPDKIDVLKFTTNDIALYDLKNKRSKHKRIVKQVSPGDFYKIGQIIGNIKGPISRRDMITLANVCNFRRKTDYALFNFLVVRNQIFCKNEDGLYELTSPSFRSTALISGKDPLVKAVVKRKKKNNPKPKTISDSLISIEKDPSKMNLEELSTLQKNLSVLHDQTEIAILRIKQKGIENDIKMKEEKLESKISNM